MNDDARVCLACDAPQNVQQPQYQQPQYQQPQYQQPQYQQPQYQQPQYQQPQYQQPQYQQPQYDQPQYQQPQYTPYKQPNPEYTGETKTFKDVLANVKGNIFLIALAGLLALAFIFSFIPLSGVESLYRDRYFSLFDYSTGFGLFYMFSILGSIAAIAVPLWIGKSEYSFISNIPAAFTAVVSFISFLASYSPEKLLGERIGSLGIEIGVGGVFFIIIMLGIIVASVLDTLKRLGKLKF
jgi:hypothetical protein